MAPRPLKPIPRNLVQVEQAQITPYIQAKPDSGEGTVFSRNRGEDISRKNDNVKDISVGLEDIDNAIQYYFDNVIKPTVIQNPKTPKPREMEKSIKYNLDDFIL